MSTKNKHLREIYDFLENHKSDFIKRVNDKTNRPEHIKYLAKCKVKLETTDNVAHYSFLREIKYESDVLNVYIQRKIKADDFPNITIHYQPRRIIYSEFCMPETTFYPKDFNDFYVLFHKIWFAMIESHKPILEYVKDIDNQNEINEVHFETFENKIEKYISKFPGVEIVRYNDDWFSNDDIDEFKIKEKYKNLIIRIGTKLYKVEFFMGNDGEINRMKHYCFSDDLPEILSEMMKPWK